ncbi:hypothetical protein MMC30_001711 [Trapelia coarctata]|nr:hypothetical protein [Trapelia coarctata]
MPSVAVRLLRAYQPFLRRCVGLRQFEPGLPIDRKDTRNFRARRETVWVKPTVNREFPDDDGSLLTPDAPVSSWKLWRKRLESFHQFDYESSLEQAPLGGIRLVDRRKWQYDPELWLQLVRFRERVDGLRGVAVIWRGYAQRKIPPVGSQASVDLWNSFLRLGFQDHEVLREMCEYKGFLVQHYRGRTPGLYYEVMKHIILTKPSELYEWHLRLKHESPYTWQRRELLNLAIAEGSAFRALLPVYENLPQVHEYQHIVPRLCAHVLYSDAVQWHRMLMRKGDTPQNAYAVQSLLHHLEISGQVEAYTEMMEEMSNAGVVLHTSSVPTRQHTSVIYQQIMKEIQATFHPTEAKAISDEFCARLFATKVFSVQSIINGLHMFGVDTIGPLALREIAAREAGHVTIQPEGVLQDLEHLRQAGISVGSSKFSRLVQKAAREFDAELLFDIVASDQHPEVYEDWKLQESLLASYHNVGDRRQINRTLAILTLDENKESLDTARWNLLLRSYLTLSDMPNTWITMDKMRGDAIILRKTSRVYLWNQTVAASKGGQVMTKAENLPRIIRIWQGFMRSGTHIPQGDWVEVLRRLGVSNQLKQYERLAWWLARWYTDEEFRSSQLELVMQRQSVRRPMLAVVPSDQTDPAHPFQILFSERMQKAILRWGFKSYIIPKVRSTSPSERARVLSQAPSLWGLRMITKLRDVGVKIDREVVAKFCRTRLATLFRKEVPDRRVKPVRRLSHRVRQQEYAHAMETIWGSDLFGRAESRSVFKEIEPAKDHTGGNTQAAQQ